MSAETKVPRWQFCEVVTTKNGRWTDAKRCDSPAKVAVSVAGVPTYFCAQHDREERAAIGGGDVR